MSTLKVVCNQCEKVINLKVDKHVLLGTYTGEDIDDESYFHFDCFNASSPFLLVTLLPGFS